MKTRNLKTDILFSFFAVIGIFAVFTVVFAFYEIKHNIIQKAQRQIKNDLKIGRWVYDSEIEKIRMAFSLVGPLNDLEKLKEKIGLDYLYVIDARDKGKVKSEIVLKAFTGVPVAGTRLIGKEELKEMGGKFYEQAAIALKETPKAKATSRKISEIAMAAGYAKPLMNNKGEVQSVMYGGRILNRDFGLVDKIRDSVFENQLYDSKPIGTVTIFLDDVRIATNVLDREGKRALGTRVSETVYKKVVGEGLSWMDRAFVVTDWYLTAYEPIKNIRGEVIGILYVGTLEKPFQDMIRKMFFFFLGIVIFATILAAILAFILADAITKPLAMLLEATGRISGGDLDYRIKTLGTRVRELNVLASSFDHMADKLVAREKSLKIINEKLEVLNKSYLDLISFVAHELKGILSSAILSAYTVRDGFLGMINFKQRKTLDSVVRNLDYFSSTVINFLDLSRIEKGELIVRKRELLLKEDVFDTAVDAFLKRAEEKSIKLVDRIAPGLKGEADTDLLRIVAHNLIGNAVKYGREGGSIVVAAENEGTRWRVEVYGDGNPIGPQQKERLFKKFSRLDTPETNKAHGTGLGLFIAKEIIEKHGGKIWLETRESGNAFIFEIERGA
jgi:signal transduction histidine kinase